MKPWKEWPRDLDPVAVKNENHYRAPYGIQGLRLLAFLGLALSSVLPLLAETVQDVAVPIPWAEGSPSYSDVSMRSLIRYDGTQKRKDQNGGDIYPNTLISANEFHISRIDWSYANPSNPLDKTFIDSFTSNDISYSLTFLMSVPAGKESDWGMETSTHGWARRPSDNILFGCKNKPSFLSAVVSEAELKTDNMPSSSKIFYFQRDDPRSQEKASQYSGSLKGCFCDYCAAKFKSKCVGNVYRGGNGDYIVSTTTLGNLNFTLSGDTGAFLQLSRDTDREYFVGLKSAITAYVQTRFPQKKIIFSCNGPAYDSSWSPNIPENGALFNQFDFWVSEVSALNTNQQWFWNLRGFLPIHQKKILTTSSFISDISTFRKTISGSFAVGINYLVPWDMYLAQYAMEGRRFFPSQGDFADLYGFIRGTAQYLDGYEDAAGAGPDITDSREGEKYGGIAPVQVSAGSGSLYAFTRAKPGNPLAPVVVHLVDWANTPIASTVTLSRSRLFPDKQITVHLLTPKTFNAAEHNAVESSLPKDYTVLVSSVNLPVAWNGNDEVKVNVPPLNPWGMLVVAPSPIGPPAHVTVTSVTPWTVSLSYETNDNPLGTDYIVNVSSDGFRTYFTALTTKSLTPQITGLKPATTYTIRVRGVNPGGALTWSSRPDIQFTTIYAAQDVVPPTFPQLAMAGGNQSVGLSWTSSTDGGGSGLAKYRLDMSLSETFSTFVPGCQDRDMGLMISTNIAGLTPDTTYFARVRVEDLAGNRSAYSLLASAHTFPEITPPSISLTASAPNTVYSSPQTVSITATASDAQGNNATTPAVPVTIDMGAPPPLIPKDTILDDEKYNHFGIVSQDQIGWLHLIYRKGTSHTAAGSAVERSSQDGGMTWSSVNEILPQGISSPTDDVRVGCIGTTSTGRILVVYSRKTDTQNWRLAYSDDRAVTWTTERIFDPSLTQGLPYGRLLALPDGRLLVTGYVALNGTFSLANWFSSNNGDTWTRGTDVYQYHSSSGYLFSEHSVIAVTTTHWLAVSRGQSSLMFFKTTDGGDSWAPLGEMQDVRYSNSAYTKLVAPMLDLIPGGNLNSPNILLTYADRETNKSYFRIGRTENFISEKKGRVGWGPALDYAQNTVGRPSGYQSGIFIGSNRARYLLIDYDDRQGSQSVVRQFSLDLSHTALYENIPSPSDTTDPTVPQNIRATEVTANSIRITWDASTDDASTGVARYGIDFSLNSSFTSFVRNWRDRHVEASQGKSATCEGLTPNTNYFVRARAYDAAGNVSADSPPLTVKTLRDLPSGLSVVLTAPTPNTTFISPQRVSIIVDKGGTVDIAKVWLALNGVNVATFTTTPPYDFSWDITAANNGTHSWMATAFDAQGNSSTTLALPVTVNIDGTTPTAAMTAPLPNTFYSTPQTVSVMANATDNVGVTKVWFIQNGVVVATDTAAPYVYNWSITAADNGNYTWQSKAFDAIGNSATTIIVPVTVAIDVTLPFVPTNLHPLIVTSSTVALTWNSSTDNVGVVGYRIRRDSSLIATVTNGMTSYTDSGLASNTSFTYAVLAFDAAGNESPWTPDLAVTTPRPPLFAPTGSVTGVTSQTVSLQWLPTDNATRYTLAGALSNTSAPPFAFQREISETVDSISGLTPNTTYFLFLNACDDSHCTEFTSAGEAVTLAKTPRLKSLQVQGHEAYLTIDPQGNPAGTLYQVDMAHAGGPFVSAVSGPTLSVVVPGLTPGDQYQFRVMAVNHEGVRTTESNILAVSLAPETLNEARAYPSPFHSGLGATGITFDRLPEESSIKIFTMDGRPVTSLMTNASGEVLWLLTNDEGTPVASGVYVAAIKKDGSTKVFKIMIQK